MTEVLVIGGGPAGAATAYWLAREGHSVVVVERRPLRRDKTCGDALTPRAASQLADMGLLDALRDAHRTTGIRLTGFDRDVAVEWPDHPSFPKHGYVVRRTELDQLVIENAVHAGARLLQAHDALRPLVSRGFVRGAIVQDPSGALIELDAKYVVIADGANSRYGRSLGTFRARDWPYGTAIRSYWSTPRHAEEWLEANVALTDRSGNSIPGYGWVFPLGDGTANVGVGLLSTFRDFNSVNTTHLLDSFAEQIADRWGIDPTSPERKPVSGRIPMGGSVSPKAGPTYLVVGDAAGAVNPFNGAGLDYAYETGRLAAEVLHEALVANDSTVLQQYPRRLDDAYGQYFKVARLFARVAGRPTVMRRLAHLAVQNRTLVEWVLRIMANELRPDELGPAEAAYKLASGIARLAPST